MAVTDIAGNGNGSMPEQKKKKSTYHDPKVVMALRNFAVSISVFNILGYTVLGFEQPWLWPIIAVGTGYTVELVLETIGARVEDRRPRYRGNGPRGLMEFLYPSHITSLAVGCGTT
jgi:hypothetical protein